VKSIVGDAAARFSNNIVKMASAYLFSAYVDGATPEERKRRKKEKKTGRKA